jgi:hypothetical protein
MFHPSHVAAARPSIALSTVTRAATAGDEYAWDHLVTRRDGVLRTVARRYRLCPDADDSAAAELTRAV